MKKSIAKIDAVGEQIAALNEKVSEIRLNKARRRSGKAHSPEKVAAVMTAWTVYTERATARMSVNTRPTNSGAFKYSRRQLELAGVSTLKEFSEIKHSIRTREYRARLKALEAKRPGSSSRKCTRSLTK